MHAFNVRRNNLQRTHRKSSLVKNSIKYFGFRYVKFIKSKLPLKLLMDKN